MHTSDAARSVRFTDFRALAVALTSVPGLVFCHVENSADADNDIVANLTDRFPEANVLVGRRTEGDTLIEAYWKSVCTPGQGLFVGEPLARPWGT